MDTVFKKFRSTTVQPGKHRIFRFYATNVVIFLYVETSSSKLCFVSICFVAMVTHAYKMHSKICYYSEKLERKHASPKISLACTLPYLEHTLRIGIRFKNNSVMPCSQQTQNIIFVVFGIVKDPILI